jgi:lysylphosphatidylglycerol synthetase-like protein (DUF2156 family)
MDILRVVCIIITMVITLILLVIIAFNRTCRTVPMLLVANTCLAELLCVCTALSLVAFTLENDVKQIQYKDSLCTFRACINYSLTVIQNLSYAHQAVYRYIVVIYPARIFWQSTRFQVCVISIT